MPEGFYEEFDEFEISYVKALADVADAAQAVRRVADVKRGDKIAFIQLPLTTWQALADTLDALDKEE